MDGMFRMMFLATLAAALWTAPVNGDGKFFAPPGLPAPSIPGQRAAIIVDGGIETMVIDTQLIAGANDVAWIIPTPAPAEVLAAPRGIMETLDVATGTTFVPRPLSNEAIFAGLATILLALGWLLVPGRIGVACGAIVVVAVAAMVLALPALGVGGSRSLASKGVKSKGAEVEILSQGVAGDFEFTVLRGEHAGAVAGWLRDAGFHVPEAALPVLDAYVGDGWAFAAGRLTAAARVAAKSTSSNRNVIDWRPHPIALRFPTGTPIYPMRLTGVDEATVSLRLFVLADNPFASDVLDQVSMLPISWRSPGDPPVVDMPADTCLLGLPALRDLAPRARFASRLEGNLMPAHLAADVRLAPDPTADAHRPVVERALDRRQSAWLFAASTTVLLSLVAGAVGAARGRRGGTRPAAGCAVAALIVGAAVGLGLHIVGAGTAARARLAEVGSRHETGARRAIAMVRGATVSPGLAVDLRRDLDSFQVASFNPLLRWAPLREEASPGNWLIVDGERGIEYVWFDAAGAPHATVVARAGDGALLKPGSITIAPQ